MPQYVLLDTNILFRYVTQGEPGCEPEHFDALRELVRYGKIKLFCSEVVDHEFQGQCDGLQARLKRELQDIEVRIKAALCSVVEELFPSHDKESKKRAWNELKDLQPLLTSEVGEFSKRLKEWHEQKTDHATRRMAEVKALMISAVVDLPFDHDLIVRTKRRFLAKRFKQFKNDSKPEADYYIVDSVVRFFEKNEKEPVLFCSENTNDLALDVDGKFILHPCIEEDFPKGSGLFRSLAELVSFIKENKPLDVPSPEKIQAAVEREKLEREFDSGQFRSAVHAIHAIVTELDYLANCALRLDPDLKNRINELVFLSMKIPIAVNQHSIIRVEEMWKNASDVLGCTTGLISDLKTSNRLISDRIFDLDAACSELLKALAGPD